MTAEAAIKEALEGLGVPVERLTYRGNADTFITYQLVVSTARDFSDDENAAEEFTFRIDLFSRKNHIATLRALKQALKAHEFYEISTEAETYENDTKYYHIPIGAKYLECVEVAEE